MHWTRWNAQRFDAGTGPTKNEMENGSENCNITGPKKAAEWNPDLSSSKRTNRTIVRPKKRWEDDINEFLKQEFEENENTLERGKQTNKNLDQHCERP